MNWNCMWFYWRKEKQIFIYGEFSFECLGQINLLKYLFLCQNISFFSIRHLEADPQIDKSIFQLEDYTVIPAHFQCKDKNSRWKSRQWSGKTAFWPFSLFERLHFGQGFWWVNVNFFGSKEALYAEWSNELKNNTFTCWLALNKSQKVMKHSKDFNAPKRDLWF